LSGVEDGARLEESGAGREGFWLGECLGWRGGLHVEGAVYQW